MSLYISSGISFKEIREGQRNVVDLKKMRNRDEVDVIKPESCNGKSNVWIIFVHLTNLFPPKFNRFMRNCSRLQP